MKPGAGAEFLSDDSNGGDGRDDQEATDETPETDDVDDLLEDAVDGEDDSSSNGGSDDSGGYSLPWIHWRDKVKSDRPEIIQMHVRESTVDGEDDL